MTKNAKTVAPAQDAAVQSADAAAPAEQAAPQDNANPEDSAPADEAEADGEPEADADDAAAEAQANDEHPEAAYIRELLARNGLPRAYVLASGICFDEKYARHMSGDDFDALPVIEAK
jgi:hypothetical protein